MSREIFRKVALERLSSPDQLDQLVRITSTASWLSLVGLLCLLTLTVAWALLGSVPTEVTGRAMLVNSGGVRNVVAPAGGQVDVFLVAAGDAVEASQVLARITGDDGSSHDVASPFDGRVLEVRAGSGQLVSRGTVLLGMERTGDDVTLEAVMFLPTSEGRQVSPGMAAQVSPSTVRRELHGYLEGEVSRVAPFPSSSEGILAVLGSEDLAEALEVGTAPIEVHVALRADRRAPSGFRWSSGAGPDEPLGSGTLGTVTVITGEQRPLDFVLPSGS